MRRSNLIRQRLTALAFFGAFIFFSPLVVLFDRVAAPVGMPLLYLYLFGGWALIIGLSAWILGMDRE
ncbi:MAG: hypothetical protein KBE53_08725 [Chromatiaceae bacterium]|nr:hypothetical protein [Chromatiaceae bacterium]